jgi:molybdate transport system ATP-binding protein
MELTIDISKSFGSFTLNCNCLAVGDRLGIFGRSGSGKSTLVGILAGLVKPDRGRVLLDGEPLYDSSRGIDLPAEKRRIAVVFQYAHLFPHLTVRQNLLFGQRRCPVGRRMVDFATMVDTLALDGLLEQRPATLSGGEQQRVALGRALLASPRLLLLDEPLSALDDDLKFQIIPYLQRVGERFRIPYCLISHSLVEMRLLTDRVLVFENGVLTAQLTPDELAQLRMGTSPVGYINLLRLADPQLTDGLATYAWGDTTLCLTAGSGSGAGLFELSSKDIILCKKHPEAISARNLLAGRVVRTFAAGHRTGVEIGFGDQRLIAEIVTDAARELAIVPGTDIYAVIKASAFRRLAA